MSLEVNYWGEIDYVEASRRQMELVDLVKKDPRLQYLNICRHPPIVTLGRKSTSGDVTEWRGATSEIQRGGKATYHGPSQTVIYPILHLGERANRRGLRPRDLHGYLRMLEQSVIEVLKAFDIFASNRPSDEILSQFPGAEATGVWVKDQKICSIGIGVKNWVAFHGLALNIFHDPKAFQGMRPCGFVSDTMTSIEKFFSENGLATKPSKEIFREDVESVLVKNLRQKLEFV